MSEFELVTAHQNEAELWLTTVSIFITVLFAYIAAAYLVGAKLSRLQMSMITLLYSGFSFFLLATLSNQAMKMAQFATEVVELNPDRIAPFAGTPPESAPAATAVIVIAAYLTSLAFMLQIRHAARKPAK